ncbi:hypothetical protein JHJ32_15590 [Parapedobacter sp. ISTM3]|uniref:MetA-pathway of phenol degradation n=1 Tax=Parapedobacter luteus TaxID=623280 RepID=A0A1T5FDY7_9SPHI|nr:MULTISPECIES: DUF6733 family protein [Parapedobacter]MBK1441422.1 hypothetical protein [Parapedobacter sp. ISTM3]SKB94327.1 hypothetical protein SAMN05660226_03918 [Parapedobacter luteus]
MKKKITPLSLQTLLSVLFLIVVSTTNVAAQDDDDDFSFTLALVSDQFFGFAPSFSGAYSLNPTVDLTFYGIMWSAGTGAGWGNWTEFGVGANFNVADGFGINPNLGITGGNLLSSGAEGPSIFGDGIVPNVILSLDKPRIDGEVYFGYYAPLRDKAPAGGTTLSYVHYWANAGYKVSPKFSFGAHFEHLINSGGSNVSESTDVYQWLGPYIQFSSPKYGVFSRLTAGGDFIEGNDSFFKVSAGFSF